MNTEKNQYGVNASLPRKIFSQAKNLNLKWNFSCEGEIISALLMIYLYITFEMTLLIT